MKVELIKISEIDISDRARGEFGDTSELEASIKKYGLIHPIRIDTDKRLVVGGRRLEAVKRMGAITIPAIYIENLSPLELKEIELSENLDRKSLTWMEEVTLKRSINDMKKEADPSWKIEDTAKLTGKSESATSNDLFLARMLEGHPELAEEKTKVDATRRAKRIAEKAKRELLSSIEVSESKFKDTRVSLWAGDCVKGIRAIEDESVDLILTDFPFGVNFGRDEGFVSRVDETYEDEKSTLLDYLLPKLASEFARVLRPGAHFYIFFPNTYYKEFQEELGKHLNLRSIPLIWHKTNVTHSRNPYTLYSPNYEPIFYGYKAVKEGVPCRKLASSGQSVLSYPNAKGKIHPAEKPLELLTYLIEQSTVKNETVLDVFSGSGATMEACLRTSRKGISMEKSTHWYEAGVERISKVKGELA